jgi:hypothetical protein
MLKEERGPRCEDVYLFFGKCASCIKHGVDDLEPGAKALTGTGMSSMQTAQTQLVWKRLSPNQRIDFLCFLKLDSGLCS